jgi:hypothetical protein
MGLKLKVEKLEDVPEAQRALYTEIDGGGGYQLGVDDLPDVGPALRAKDHEVAEHGKTKAELKRIKDAQKKIEDDARKAVEDAARASGDVKTIEESWKKKHADALIEKDNEYQPKLKRLDTTVRRLLVSDVATRLATELALKGSEGPLAKLISSRLDVEEIDGEHVTVVRDVNGKPSALTVDDLKKEISGDKALAPLLAGTKASGGGAPGGKGGGAPGAKQISRAAFGSLDAAAQREHIRGGGTVTD